MDPAIARTPRRSAAPGAASGSGPDSGADARAALRAYLAAHYAGLHRRLQRRLGCADLACECLHDVWLRLGEASIAAPVLNPEAYLLRMAHNVAMDHLRSRRDRHCTDDGDDQLARISDGAPGPDAVADARSQVQAVDHAMRRLPPRHRSVLLALRVEEQTRQQVADRHGLSLRNVDTLLRQALDHCAAEAGQTAPATAGAPRRGLPARWYERLASRSALEVLAR